MPPFSGLWFSILPRTTNRPTFTKRKALTTSLSKTTLSSPPNPKKIKAPVCQKKKKMKKLYRKKKSSRGKIHPSPSPSHASTHSLSVLNLLPSAILTIVSVLSVDDQEVLAYLIHCSITTTTTTNPSTKQCNKPTFNCGCFDCYTRFWIRWDSSPNRHLIHQAIEAFEDHLSPSDHPSDKTHKSKPMNLRVSADKSVLDSVSGSLEPETSEPVPPAACTSTSGDAAAESATQCGNAEHEPTGNLLQPVASVHEQRGLVRKVWPEVLGLFNSRLRSLWNPSV